jgi:hypothetical protein
VTQLHQIIALEKGAKSRAAADYSAALANLGKVNLLAGRSRTYKPLEDGGTELPPESQRVQLRTTEVLADVRTALTRLFDITLTKDVANATATAPIVVDGQTVAADVPVSYLLWLEKRLVELADLVKRLPVLDPVASWQYDDNADVYRTEPVRTLRTRKVPRNHVLAEATKEHPAQVQVFTEDVPEGTWTTVELSGALPQTRVNDIKGKLAKLTDAVRAAREQANSATITDHEIGDAVFGYLFG